MANINELLARAAALRDETALNSISPERAGGIMYDTLLAMNELWLQQGAALVISKIYASVAAMEADTAPVSDLTGKPLRPGQIVVIASSDSDNGSVYRYNGTEAPRWSLVGSIGNLEPVDNLESDSTALPLAAHQGKVLDGKISQLGQQVIYDVSKKNEGATFASLSALLSDENLSTLIPVAVRCGGMSIRFVQSSDNKYVQYRLTADTFTTTASEWQKQGAEVSALLDSDTGLENLQIGNDVYSLSNVQSGLIRLYSFASSRPQDIKSGEIYFNTASKELIKIVGSSYEIIPFIPDTYYSVGQRLYIWNGTNMILAPQSDCLNKVIVGKGLGAYGFGYIALKGGRYYKLTIPVAWNKPSGAGEMFFVDDTNNNYVLDTSGEVISYSSLLSTIFLFKATYSGIYRIGIVAEKFTSVNIQIEDVSELINNGLNGKKSLGSELNVGSIVNNAEIGQVPTLITDTDAGWRYIVKDVKEGEIYYIKGAAGASSRLFVILDSNDRVLKRSDANANIQTEFPLMMPSGAAKLTVNFAINVYPCSLGTYDNQYTLLIKQIQSKVKQDIPLIGGSIVSGGSVGTRPSLTKEVSGGWLYAVVDVVEGEQFLIKGKGASSSDYPLYCILGTDNRIIYTTGGGEYTADGELITIPFDGKKLVVNVRGTQPHYLKGLSTIPSEKQSPYFKEVNYGVVPTDDYIGSGVDYSWGADNTLTSAVYDKYDTLINTNGNISDRTVDVNDGYIYRTKIGNASDNQPLVMYEFRPLLAISENIPKIFIICGQHGFEKQSAFGMWYLLNDMVNNTDKSNVAKYLREFVDIFVVPVANPSGWDIRSYTNSNGVNLNRNWAVTDWVKTTEPSTEVSGDAPFDQPETSAIRDAILAVDDIVLLMDCHQNGANVVTIQNINWIDITYIEDKFFNRVRKAANYELSSITRLFRNLYQNEIGGTNELCGYIGNPWPLGIGYADLWAVENDIIGVTHEGFGGFPLGTVNNPNSHKANSELLGNFIKNFLYYYNR